MAVRQRRRTTDATQNIKAAVGAVFACGVFFAKRFELPSEKGAQLSMTGDIVAVGNGGGFREDSLAQTLRSFPSMWKSCDKEIGRFIGRKRFTVLCGDCDRSVAILGAIVEMVRSGINKIIIAADTPVERDNLAQSLELMRAGLGGIEIMTYRMTDYDSGAHYKAYASIYAFLTSGKPEILILGRDSFSRKSNILRRNDSDEKKSLADLLREAHPVVITSSVTVESGRTLARNSAVFEPTATVIFAGEERRLRDCVIYKPESYSSKNKRNVPDVPEQLGF